MASKSLEQQIATIRQSLFTEELILDEQFAKLEELEGEDDPNFAENFANIYLSESTKYIDTIEQTFEAIALDVAKLDECLDSFQRDSACLGANKVIIEITKMLHCCRRGDMEGCKAGFLSLKLVFDNLKNKLEAYLELLQQDRPDTSSSGPQ